MRFPTSLERGRDLSRHTNRLSSSMMDLSGSTQQRGGMFEKSRIAHSSHGASRMSREATRDTRSLLSQSVSDVRGRASDVQGSWTKDDQYLSNRGYGFGGSSSLTAARQSLLSSRSPSSFFHRRSLSGFDASRSSGFSQSGSAFRNDHFFLPSVGILGGVSQTRVGGAFGGSMFGGYSGMSGLHSGIGFQRPMTGLTVYGQGAASGFDGRLYTSASLSNLHQQFPSQVQGISMNSASQQGSVDVAAGNSDCNGPSVPTSTGGSHQVAAAQQAEGCAMGSASDAAVIEVICELDLKDSTNGQSHVDATSQQAEDQAVGDLEVESTPPQAADLGNDDENNEENDEENNEELTVPSLA